MTGTSIDMLALIGIILGVAVYVMGATRAIELPTNT